MPSRLGVPSLFLRRARIRLGVKGLIVHNESVDNGFETGMQQCE